jgi:CRP-like cAMP-binding protein
MFTSGALVLQLGCALLVAAAITARRTPRMLLAGVAVTGLAHTAWWSGDWIMGAWMGLLLACCLALLGRDWLTDRRVRFTAEEETMLAGFLAGVPRHVSRHLIDRGLWLHGTVGDELTREGVPVERLVYLASGSALVMSDARQVASCGPGDLIGEASILTGEPATATVILAGPARFWCMPAAELRHHLDGDEALRVQLERSFARALRNKLHASNRTIAAAGGVA